MVIGLKGLMVWIFSLTITQSNFSNKIANFLHCLLTVTQPQTQSLSIFFPCQFKAGKERETGFEVDVDGHVSALRRIVHRLSS